MKLNFLICLTLYYTWFPEYPVHAQKLEQNHVLLLNPDDSFQIFDNGSHRLVPTSFRKSTMMPWWSAEIQVKSFLSLSLVRFLWYHIGLCPKMFTKKRWNEPFQILPALFYRRNCVERTLSNVNGKYTIEPWLSTNRDRVQLVLT